MITRACIGSTLFVAALATAPTGFAQDVNGEQCPPRDGKSIVITVGDIDCVTAADYAAQYDVNGDKYQAIGPFTCYSATAATAPLLFQCVEDSADPAEFAVYPG
ncbi:hypothetical protein [Mycolicibacterium holsaticum]|jgi:hypothetical protein|uniref:hypothetical protein n=1 Tax=Mycolicibacterium holsaticum TaxID=152142 RepID=UPI000DA17DF1|nr:hypothetical protein [Mycolicibacterium holsaticum]QZA10665.1 hypothetical protein K3U96_15385 [Mycolicibacterium holsaticum DSM 44478 = JCM 12374]UNC11831.1 hypothetical protein H5U41_11445 [Mycolicibacterium holsaticum DSM 44478 = JCM 12374]